MRCPICAAAGGGATLQNGVRGLHLGRLTLKELQAAAAEAGVAPLLVEAVVRAAVTCSQPAPLSLRGHVWLGFSPPVWRVGSRHGV
jgi:hypothetical protein